MTKRSNQLTDWCNVNLTTQKKESAIKLGPWFMLAFVILACLRIAGVISWSWWAVTAPLWGPFAFILGFIGIIFAICAVIALVCMTAAGIVMFVSGIAKTIKS